MNNMLYVATILDEGYFNGIFGVYADEESATKDILKEGFKMATEDEFSYYGDVDYVDPDDKRRRITVYAIESDLKISK